TRNFRRGLPSSSTKVLTLRAAPSVNCIGAGVKVSTLIVQISRLLAAIALSGKHYPLTRQKRSTKPLQIRAARLRDSALAAHPDQTECSCSARPAQKHL